MLTIKKLKERFEALTDEKIAKSIYKNKFGHYKIRLTNTNPRVALVPALLDYILDTNKYIKQFNNVNKHTTRDYIDNSYIDNRYRDLTILQEDMDELKLELNK